MNYTGPPNPTGGKGDSGTGAVQSGKPSVSDWWTDTIQNRETSKTPRGWMTHHKPRKPPQTNPVAPKCQQSC